MCIYTLPVSFRLSGKSICLISVLGPIIATHLSNAFTESKQTGLKICKKGVREYKKNQNYVPMDKQTVKDIQRTIMMKLNKIDYTVDLIGGYEDTEHVYKQLRDKLGEVIDSITWLMTYEHGGSKMKSLYSKMTMITTTSKINYFKNHDIYEANGLVGLDLSKVELSSGLNDVSKKYSKAYMDVSKYKLEMNNMLKLQIEKISELRDQSNAIDKKRKKVANIRYDLEMERKSKSPKTSESLERENELERDFKELSKIALGDMERFVGNDGVSGVLQKVAEAHLEFSEKTAKALSTVK